MNVFGVITVNVIVSAVVLAIIYFIFNAIYNGAYSAKGTSVFSGIVCLIMFLVLIFSRPEPQVDGFEFLAGTTGLLAFLTMVLTIPVANAMVALMEGDDVLQGIGQSIGVIAISTGIAIIILLFSETYWPFTVLAGVGLVSSVVTFFRD